MRFCVREPTCVATGRKVLAVPRCCQRRKGTTDRPRVNDGVAMRDAKKVQMS
jgi:hypothetical protein